jgi:hypothetical protein
LSITLLNQLDLNKKYRIVREDELKEKGYTSLDKLAKRLKEIGIEVFAIVLTDNQS